MSDYPFTGRSDLSASCFMRRWMWASPFERLSESDVVMPSSVRKKGGHLRMVSAVSPEYAEIRSAARPAEINASAWASKNIFPSFIVAFR